MTLAQAQERFYSLLEVARQTTAKFGANSEEAIESQFDCFRAHEDVQRLEEEVNG